MDRVYERCCGIDVHKKIVVACFRCGRKQELREFGTTTKELLRLADWLIQNECQMIAMESTASYWKPLYNVFESCELKAMVVNARHMKAVPGRKTDTNEQWVVAPDAYVVKYDYAYFGIDFETYFRASMPEYGKKEKEAIEVYGITSKPGKAKAVAQHCDTVPEFIIKLKNELVMVEFLG